MAYGTTGEVRISGLKELLTVLRHADKDLRKEVTDALKDVGEPVRLGAERLAFGHGKTGRISGLKEGEKWGQMRLGFAGGRDPVVYIAPRQRGNKTGLQKRRNFGPLLLEEAMIPALEDNADLIEKRVGETLDDLAHMWRFTG